jgi:uncharacterized membrane protein
VSDVPPPPPPPSPPPYGSVPSGGGTPDVGTALSYGFNKYFANIGQVLLIILVAFLAQVVVQILEIAVSSFFLKVIFGIIGLVVGAVVSIGIYNAALMITAGTVPTVSAAFSYDRWGEWVVFSIVYGLMVGIGLALCIIPGLFVLAFFGMAPYFFIDRGMSMGDAFAASREAAGRGFAVPVVLSVIVGALGFIACGIGALITAPAAYIAVGYLYRGATNQVAAP